VAININNQYARGQERRHGRRQDSAGFARIRQDSPGKDRRVKRINKPHRIAAKKGQRS